MIMEVDAKIDHDNMLNAFRQSAAEAIVHCENELLLDKRFVAAEEAILKHNLHTHKIPHTYKTAISSVEAAEWSNAIDTEINFTTTKDMGSSENLCSWSLMNIDFYPCHQWLYKSYVRLTSLVHQLQ
jgi:hypothetical protein